MFKRDYKIIISADVNDTTYWQLLRKGEQAACNEQEIRMVSQILGELKAKIDKQYDNKKANVNNPEELSHSEVTKISDQEEPVSNDFEMALAEMIDKARKCIVEPWAIAAQWKDELIKLAKSREPVSEELEEAAIEYCGGNKGSDARVRGGFLAGAKWKEEQFEKNRIEHCEDITEEQYNLETGFVDLYIKRLNRHPTFLDAIEYGKTLGEMLMIGEAVETTFNVSLPCGVYDKLKAKGCEEGDKLLIIKKEE